MTSPRTKNCVLTDYSQIITGIMMNEKEFVIIGSFPDFIAGSELERERDRLD